MHVIYDPIRKHVFQVLMSSEIGYWKIVFNPEKKTFEKLIGSNPTFEAFYSLEKEGANWIFFNLTRKYSDIPVTEDWLNKFPELRHYITREEHGATSIASRARTAEYFKEMEQAEAKGKCLFCPPHDWKNPPIKEGKYWIFKNNDYPYKHSSHHFVVIHRKHGTIDNDIFSVSPEDWAEFGEICQWAIKEYNLPGGGIVIRFGHPDFNASTMRHLHAHIQVPNLTGNVKATFCKDRSPEEEARRQKRLEEFQQ